MRNPWLSTRTPAPPPVAGSIERGRRCWIAEQQSAVVLEQELLIGARELDLELGLALQHLDLELEPAERRELSRGRGGKLGGRAFGRRQIAGLGHEIHGDRVDRAAARHPGARRHDDGDGGVPPRSSPPPRASCRSPPALRRLVPRRPVPPPGARTARRRAGRRGSRPLIALAAVALTRLGALAALIAAMAAPVPMPAWPAMALRRRSLAAQVESARGGGSRCRLKSFWVSSCGVSSISSTGAGGCSSPARLLAHRALGIDLDHHVAPLAQESVAPLDALVVEVVGLDAVVLRGHQDRLLERGAGEELAGRFTHRFLTRAARSFLPAGAPIDGTVSSPPMYPAFFKR